MITAQDVIDAYPQVEGVDPDLIEQWAMVANHTIFEDRVKDARTIDQVRALFVMHQLERPALDIKAPHVLARMGMSRNAAAAVKTPHPWSGTEHGKRVIAATKF